jgi:cell division protein FtsL
MKLLKQSIYVLVLLLVVVLVWVGFSIYFQAQDAEVNPNASSYTNHIDASFDIDEINNIKARISSGFSVSPEEFFLLTEED